jgi:hypothetical protein
MLTPCMPFLIKTDQATLQAEEDVRTAALAVHERDNCIMQTHKTQTEKAEQQVYALKSQLAAETVASTRRIAQLQVCFVVNLA